MNQIIAIDSTIIRQDVQGRYCINDLHKASGGNPSQKPSEWLRNKQTQELVEEITKAGIPALVSVHGGSSPGTYVCKELVYAYAMWISASFHLKVIRAYDKLVSTPLDPVESQARVTMAQLAVTEQLAKMLNVHGSGLLGMCRRVVDRYNPSYSDILPSYAVDHPLNEDLTPVAGNTGSSEVTRSLTDLLGRYGVGLSARKVNQMLIEHGYLFMDTRPSSKDPSRQKTFPVITEKGLAYGKNLSNDKNQRETQPHWYDKTFPELMGKIGLETNV